MIDRWFRTIRLPLTLKQWQALPQNPAYKYEYIDGQAWLTPRPEAYHAMLDLRPMAAPEVVDAREPARVRPLAEEDWADLPGLFAGAFSRVQPFASLDDDTRLEAARDCLEHTRTGGDGPAIAPACFVAVAEDGTRLGAILVTLMRAVDLATFDDPRWKGGGPPPDWLERRLGRPHLTWVFVGPWHAGHGVGSALLAAAVNALLALGYRELASTFLLGNVSSMLWHWRSGFRLLAYPGSIRRLRQRLPPGRPAPEPPPSQ